MPRTHRDRPLRYREVSKSLAPLQTFDPRVFIGEDRECQEVCDFVLSLALVYNDLRDFWLLRLELPTLKGKEATSISPQRGEAAGILIHFSRIIAGMTEELLDLIRKNRRCTISPLFQRALRRMGSDGRSCWAALESVAEGKSSKSSLGRSIALVRNIVGYHYIAGQLGVAYRARFGESTDSLVPFLSRGRSLGSTRFYFADAAAEEYLVGQDARAAFEAASNPATILDKLRVALYSVVVSFIDERGGSAEWRAGSV